MSKSKPLAAPELAYILPTLDGQELNFFIRKALADPTATDAELDALHAEFALRKAATERATFH